MQCAMQNAHCVLLSFYQSVLSDSFYWESHVSQPTTSKANYTARLSRRALILRVGDTQDDGGSLTVAHKHKRKHTARHWMIAFQKVKAAFLLLRLFIGDRASRWPTHKHTHMLNRTCASANKHTCQGYSISVHVGGSFHHHRLN